MKAQNRGDVFKVEDGSVIWAKIPSKYVYANSIADNLVMSEFTVGQELSSKASNLRARLTRKELFKNQYRQIKHELGAVKSFKKLTEEFVDKLYNELEQIPDTQLHTRKFRGEYVVLENDIRERNGILAENLKTGHKIRILRGSHALIRRMKCEWIKLE